MSIQIQNVEQEVCGHFIWDLARKAIRDKFKFDFDIASPGTTLHSSHSFIAVDEFDAHYTIVNRAFQYLSSEPSEQTLEIGKYLGWWLPHHLIRLRQLEDEDKGTLDSKEKMKIGQSLYDLFKDSRVFQRHSAGFQQAWWYASEMEGIQEWFNDSVVVRRVDKKWRDEVQKSTNLTRGYLKELARTVVEGFLKARTWDVSSAVDWIIEFKESLYSEPAGDSDPNSADKSGKVDWDTVNAWEDLGAWSQEFLKIPDSEVDALWYERLAEASSVPKTKADTVLSLYQRAIEKGNHSWMCHRGLATAYYNKGEKKEAITQLDLALEEMEKENVEPKPEMKDAVDIRLRLGDYAYEVGENTKAAENYLKASKSKDPTQARSGQFGYFRTRLGATDVDAVREHLRSNLTEKKDKDTMVDMLKMVAQHGTHDELMLKIFNAAKYNSELLKDIMDAMETAAPYESEKVDNGNTEGSEEDTRGILLFDHGVATYSYKVSSDKTKDIEKALQLWNKSRNILSHANSRNALVIRQEAATMLAQHYFHDMVDGKHADHLDALTRLAKSDTHAYSSASKYLAIFYELRGQTEQAIATSTAWVKLGLQILSDDTPENDGVRFNVIRQAAEARQDFKRAAVAILVRCHPNLVTDALTFDTGVIEAEEDVKKERINELATKLATETIRITKTKVSASSQQLERIAAAKDYVYSLANTWKAVPKPDGGGAEDEVIDEKGTEGTITEGQKTEVKDTEDKQDVAQTEIAIAYKFVSSQLAALQQTHKTEIDFTAVGLGLWSCDGRLPDGKKCGVTGTYERELYHCVLCVNMDFCKDCLARLRSPTSSAHIRPCSPRHKWLRIPPMGGDMFVGPKAKTVRVPKDVKGREDDKAILEIHQGPDDARDEVELEAWKEELAKDWGLSLGDIKRQAKAETSDGNKD